MAGAKKRIKNRDNSRRAKKKVSVLNTEKIEYIDYKDANLLRRFMSDRAKVRARRVTGNDSQQQREVARAIKNAREMALVPYANRITTQRGNRNDRGDRGDRGGRGGPRRDRDENNTENNAEENTAPNEETVEAAVDGVEGVTVNAIEETAPAPTGEQA